MATPDLADELEDELLDLDRALISKLGNSYVNVARSINEEIEKLEGKIAEAKAGGQDIPKSWLYQRGRLSSLVDQVERQLERYGDVAEGVTRGSQSKAVALGIRGAKALILSELGKPPTPGLSLTFAKLQEREIAAFVGRTLTGETLKTALSKFGPAMAKDMESAIVKGLALGWGPERIARDLRGTAGGGLYQHLRLARTEVMEAHRAARLGTFRGSGAVEEWEWLTGKDERVCEFCGEMDGTRHPLEDEMDTHPNCFPGDVIVSGPRAIAGTRRWYNGEIVQITTTGGRVLPVTPNHPVLTPKGWVSVGSLCEGDYLVASLDSERMRALIHPNNYQVPSPIQDTAAACGIGLGAGTLHMPITPKDFHHDAANGDVGIVWANRQLLRDIHARVFKHPGKGIFNLRAMQALSLAGLCATCFFSLAMDPTTRRIMGSHTISSILFGRSGVHHKPISIGTPAPSYPGSSKDAGNDTSTNGIEFCKALFRYPGLVLLDDVARIERSMYHGHVYNLQTKGEWYLANGIITHNCRCSPVPITRTWEELLADAPEAVTEDGDEKPEEEAK